MTAVFFTLGISSLFSTIISFIIVIGILIFIHELGHYILAKFNDIQVEEFALGFGPGLFSFQKGETLYSIRAFPIGGFCKMTGEFPAEEEELEEEGEIAKYHQAREEGRCFYQKSILQRLSVIIMGPFMNFFLAFLVFSIMFMGLGIPTAYSSAPVIGDIVVGEPADRAGLAIGDRILSINGEPIENWEQISKIINSETGPVEMKIKRGHQVLTVTVEPVYKEGRRVIGIFPSLIHKDRGILESIRQGFLHTIFIIVAIFKALYQMIIGKMAPEFAGPVVMAKMVGEYSRAGIFRVLNLMGFISINLGIVNLLPFPALDGGRILFLGIEAVRGKPVDPRKEGFIHFIGFILLILLSVIIIYSDILKVF